MYNLRVLDDRQTDRQEARLSLWRDCCCCCCYQSVSTAASFLSFIQNVISFTDDSERCMLYAICCMLYDICCMLYDICCMLYDICCMLYAVCCMLYAVCYTLYAICCMIYAVCYTLYAICCMLYAVCYTLYDICCMLYAVWYMLYAVWYMPYAIRCMLYAVCMICRCRLSVGWLAGIERGPVFKTRSDRLCVKANPATYKHCIMFRYAATASLRVLVTRCLQCNVTENYQVHL